MNVLVNIAKLPERDIKRFLIELFDATKPSNNILDSSKYTIDVNDSKIYTDLKLLESGMTLLTICYNKDEGFYDYFDINNGYLTQRRKAVINSYMTERRDEQIDNILD